MTSNSARIGRCASIGCLLQLNQIYTAPGKLYCAERVETIDAKSGRRTTRRYRITEHGRETLSAWLKTTDVPFPVLKHPTALRLLMGHLMSPANIEAMLDSYRDALGDRHRDLAAVRDLHGDNHELRYRAIVADWGLAYYEAEAQIVTNLRDRLQPPK